MIRHDDVIPTSSSANFVALVQVGKKTIVKKSAEEKSQATEKKYAEKNFLPGKDFSSFGLIFFFEFSYTDRNRVAVVVDSILERLGHPPHPRAHPPAHPRASLSQRRLSSQQQQCRKSTKV